MRTSPNGQKLIQVFESCLKGVGPGLFTTYRCPANVVTIGWGTTRSDVPDLREGEVWPQAKCDQVFVGSLAKYEGYVQRGAYARSLVQEKYDALVSWCYNVGYRADSAVWKAVNEGRDRDVPKLLVRWNKAAGKEMAGLTRRRKAEGELYLGDYAAASRTAQTILSGSMPQMHDMPAPKPTTGDLAKEVKGHGLGGSSPLAALWAAWDSLSTFEQVLAVGGVVAIVGLVGYLAVKKIRFEKENWA